MTTAIADELKMSVKPINGNHTLMNYIGGRWVESRSPESLPIMNPSLGQQIAKVPLSVAQDVDDAARSAKAAFASWSATPIKERAQVFYRFAVSKVR